MARHKSWMPRMALIIEGLEASAITHFKRGEVEQIFKVKPSAAAHLMSVAGSIKPDGPGTDAVVSRDNLLFYLRNSPDAQDAMAELARRKKLAEAIKEDGDLARMRTVRLPITRADQWTTFQDLPNVSLQPGVLTVAFSSPEDLFAQLYKFVMAAGGEWDLFLRMCDPPAETPPNAGAADSGESADAAG